MYKLATGPIACSTAELAAVLFGVVGAKAVTIVARTMPTLVGGKSCPLHGLTKLSRVNGMINFSYQNSVNRQRERQGSPVDAHGNIEEFIAGPRSWGTRLFCKTTNRKVPLVAKTIDSAKVDLCQIATLPADQLYLELKVQKSVETQYELNGVTIPADQVTPYLRESSSVHKVILRDYRFDHLQEVAMDGKVYLLGVPC